MKTFVIATIAAVALIVTFTAQAVIPDASQTAAEVGTLAPEIEATDIHGNAFKLSDHKGKIVVLEWTNSQCPYVVKHYDSGNMQKIQKQARALEGVEWISINSSAKGKQGHTDAAKAQKIIEAQGASPTTLLIDESGTIGKTYGARTTPHMYVIDAEGKVAYAGAIDSNSSPRQSAIAGAENYVLAAVTNLKAGEAVATPQTQPYGCSVKY